MLPRHCRQIFVSFLLLAVFFFGFNEAFAQCAGFQSVVTTSSCPYIDSTGNYQVFWATLCIVQNYLTAGLASMWTGITSAAAPVIQTLLVVYVALYGCAFMLGMAGAEPKEFLFRVLKLAVVFVLTSSTNQCFFFQYVYQFFMSAMQQMAVFAGASNNAGSFNSLTVSVPFSGLDYFINQQIFMLVGLGAVALAFLFFGPGIIVSIIISIGMFYMLKGLFMMFKALAFALISLTLCLMFAPIFFCLMLFQVTRSMFDEWLHLVVSYAMQPALIFFYLVIMAQLISLPTFLFTTLQTGQVIVPHEYDFSLWHLIGWTIQSAAAGGSGWHFNGGTAGCSVPTCIPAIPPDPVCTACVNQTLPQPPVGLLTMIQFTSTGTPVGSGATWTPGANGTVVATMPLFAGVIVYLLQWIIVSVATVEFMEKVPDLATRLSWMGSGQPLFTPRLGDTQSGRDNRGELAISGASEGMILPGFTAGFGGDAVKSRFKKLGGSIPRLFSSDSEKKTSRPDFKEFKPDGEEES